MDGPTETSRGEMRGYRTKGKEKQRPGHTNPENTSPTTNAHYHNLRLVSHVENIDGLVTKLVTSSSSSAAETGSVQSSVEVSCASRHLINYLAQKKRQAAYRLDLGV